MILKPFEVVSLLDMLEIAAEDFVRMGIFLEWVEHRLQVHAHELDKQIHDISHQEFLRELESALKHCENMKLRETHIIIKESIANFKFRAPTTREVVQETEIIKRSMLAGLRARTFFMILPHRFSYMFPKGLLSERTLEEFPSVAYDIKEAGWCFAAERFSAAVYHLMRIAEYGLVSLAERFGVDEKKRRNWNTALNQIDKCLNPNKPEYCKDLSKQEEEYFTGAASWLRNVKTAYRNPVSHIPRIYEEKQARDLFQAVSSLMDHLSVHLKEVKMPPEDED
jgi:hypothetical protein